MISLLWGMFFLAVAAPSFVRGHMFREYAVYRYAGRKGVQGSVGRKKKSEKSSLADMLAVFSHERFLRSVFTGERHSRCCGVAGRGAKGESEVWPQLEHEFSPG